MIVTTKCTMDLTRPQILPEIYVVQDDRYSRNVELSLYQNGVAVEIPEDVSAVIRFAKPDGKTGAYDTLPNGEMAWKTEGNRITFALAPQVCTTAGRTRVMVTLLRETAELSTFAVCLHVTRRPHGIPESRDYYNITSFLPQPAKAETGQYLKVTWVDAWGRVAGMETAPLTGLPDVTDDQEGFFLRVVEGSWKAVQVVDGEEVDF